MCQNIVFVRQKHILLFHASPSLYLRSSQPLTKVLFVYIKTNRNLENYSLIYIKVVYICINVILLKRTLVFCNFYTFITKCICAFIHRYFYTFVDLYLSAFIHYDKSDL